MVDVAALVMGVFDALLLRGPNADRRTYEAYSITAKKFDLGSDDGLQALREAFKARSAPGAYTDPDGPTLRPWLESWRAGRPARVARRFANRAR